MMPYLQIDIPRHYPHGVKQRLAQRLGHVFADVMQTAASNVTVAFRELGDGSLWRCGDGEPVPAVAITCDIRRGRPPEQRARLAEALVAACVEDLEVHNMHLTVGFTQHSGDEVFRRGRGFYEDWTPTEAQSACLDQETK